MIEIDGTWIRDRLTPGERGQKAALARAAGLTPKQLSYILAGDRKVTQTEAPAIAAFFGETLALTPDTPAEAHGFRDTAHAYSPNPESAAQALMSFAQRGGAQPVAYQLSADRFDLALMAGDIAIIDTNSQGETGDTVICGISNPDTGDTVTDIRRRLDPWLAGQLDPVRIDDDLGRSAIYGKIIAVLRLKGLN